MRKIAQNQPQQKSANVTRSNAFGRAANQGTRPFLHFQRGIGNRALRRLLQPKVDYLKADFDSEVDPTTETRADILTTRLAVDAPRPLHAPAPITIQTKLTVNAPGDMYEAEADRVSEQVMRSQPTVQRACACDAGCSKCQSENRGNENERTQTKHLGASASGQITAPPIVHEALASQGRPLDASTRAFFEPRLGHDLSQVRVHSGEAAEQSAQELKAHAYTVGHHIVFGDGQFTPETREGRQLLAHELTHVAQQRGGNAAIQRWSVPVIGESSEVKAARERGRLIAKRIRKHTKVSKEVRATIKRELSNLEGAAKDAYLEQVKPALLAVGETQMPDTQTLPPVPVIAPDPFAPGWYCRGRDCMSDEEIYAPIKEREKKEEEELAASKEREINRLKKMMKDWRPEDQAFALELLGRVLVHGPNVDTRAVSDANRQPILDRYEAWMREVDALRLKKCADDPPGVAAKSRARFRGDLPCVSWFSDEETPGRTHASSELHGLASMLKIQRGLHSEGAHTAVDQVYWDVFEYRKLTDPKMLEQLELAGAMVGVGLGIAGAVGQKKPPVPGSPKPPTPKTPGQPREITTLTNVQAEIPPAQVLSQYKVESGFSAAYNPKADKYVALASGDASLVSGQRIRTVQQHGGTGHLLAERELVARTGLTDTSGNVGFVVVWKGNGTVQLRWNSGAINERNFGNRAAPDNFRAAIREAVARDTGFKVTE